MKDDRYVTERIEDKNGKLLMVRVMMKEYKEWVSENGEPQVFHKTDKDKIEEIRRFIINRSAQYNSG